MLCIHKTSNPYVCIHCKTFHKTKVDLESHLNSCKTTETKADVKAEEETSLVEPPMQIERMRLLLAILLKRISAPAKLAELGFNKRLIDDVLIESIKTSGRVACTDASLAVAERLKRNVEILLDWTVPKPYMEKFKAEQRSTEELLEELTS